MSEADVRAMYKYIRSLGPAGKPAPKFVPPDKVPPQPYVQFPDKAELKKKSIGFSKIIVFKKAGRCPAFFLPASCCRRAPGRIRWRHRFIA
jgi:hypothetical protein